jgi:hypothetical protein
MAVLSVFIIDHSEESILMLRFYGKDKKEVIHGHILCVPCKVT